MSLTATRPARTSAPATDRSRANRALSHRPPTLFAEAGRRSAYAVLALPLGLASVVLALCGRAARAEQLQRTAAHRFLGGPAAGSRPVGAGRVLVHGALSMPLGLPALILTGYAYVNTIRNLTYPIWYGDTDYHQAWGGPTMAGVWSVHAIGGLAFFAVCLCLVKVLTTAQAALVRRVL